MWYHWLWLRSSRGHEIVLRCDFLLDESLLYYDVVVLPGGYGGVEAMKENKQFLSLLQRMNKDHKYICSMCAAQLLLEKANLLINKKFMAYQGYENKINLLTLSFLCMCLFTILPRVIKLSLWLLCSFILLI